MKRITKKEKNFLDYIPRISEQLKFDIDDSGIVTLFKTNKGIINFIAQKLLKKPEVSQIHLDEMGSFIWKQIDAERNVYEISILVKEHFGEKAEPLYNRLCQYMRTLSDYGFITFNKIP